MPNTHPYPKTLVLGVGNELLQDEGLGIHTLRLLNTYDLPANVELIEGGTAGPQLLSLIDGVERLIVVDCIDSQAEPGAIFRFKPEDLGAFPKDYMPSSHDVGLLEVLQIGDLLGTQPDTEIFAMQPADISWGLQPSPLIQNRLRHFTDIIYETITAKL